MHYEKHWHCLGSRPFESEIMDGEDRAAGAGTTPADSDSDEETGTWYVPNPEYAIMATFHDIFRPADLNVASTARQ